MIWIYVKIYANDQTDRWYRNLLKMIAHPVCTEYKDNIKHLYFSKYHHAYNYEKNNIEDTKGELIPIDTKIPEEEEVRFIRFRLSVDENKTEEIKERITQLFTEKQGNELKCMVSLDYNAEDDLGERYGASNLNYVLNVLSGWCCYNLCHLDEETKNQQKKLQDLFHLINNIPIQPLLTKCPLSEYQVHPIIA